MSTVIDINVTTNPTEVLINATVEPIIVNINNIFGSSQALKTLNNGIILTSPQSIFTLPSGAVCQSVYVNEALYTNTANTAFLSRWVQSGTSVTLSKTIPTGARVVIQYI